MSWTAYTDSLVTGFGMGGAALCGQDGQVWALSGNLAGLQFTEGKELVSGFSSPPMNGIRVCGQKYMALRCDQDGLRGKKGQKGCAVVRSKTALVVAVYDDASKTPQEAFAAASWLANDLISKEY